MSKLNERKWKEFCISEEFNIENSKAFHKSTLIETSSNGISYISRTNLNNGVEAVVKIQDDIVNKGNTIVFGAENATFFYQPNKYITGNKMYFIHSDKLNKYSGLFSQTALNKSIQNCGFGYGMGLTGTRVKRRQVILPTKDNGKPDYQYMKQYTKSIIDKKINTYKKYACSILEGLKYKEIESLENKEWGEFFLTDIFVNIQRGKRLIKTNQQSGNKPYVSSTASNNGVDNFIGNGINVRVFERCLSIANSGSVGASFYHPYKFVASDHVTHLKNEDLSEYVYLFITTFTNRFSGKYNFNREINDKRIAREKILLPINDDKEPDYEYMEQYIVNMKHKKIKQYLDYLEVKNE